MMLAAIISEFGTALLDLSLEAAPWLIIGLMAAGLIKVLVSMEWMARWLGRPGLGSVVRASIIGTPLPLCSCGVLPAAIGLHRQGASRGATVSFLISTPANGADSLAMSYVLLGPFLAAARLVSALVSSLVAGLLAEWSPRKVETAAAVVADPTPKSCCGTEVEVEAAPASESCCGDTAMTEAAPKGDCCGPEDPKNDGEASVAGPKWIQGLRFAFSDIFDDIKFWLVIGLLGAAVVQVAVPQSFIQQYGQGWIGLGVMLVIGLPMYICATASVPVAAALLLGGVSPGAIVVFLLAGPATNIGTIMAIRKELGGGPLAGYLFGVCGGALICGWLTNVLVERWDLNLVAQVEHAHELVPASVAWAALGILVLAALVPLRRRLIGA